MKNLAAIENSSNLTGRFYDPATKTLFVRFKSGEVYQYANFSAGMAHDFEEACTDPAKSAGKYFSLNIRHLPNERIENNED